MSWGQFFEKKSEQKSEKNRSHGYRSQIFPAKGTPPGFGRALEEQ